MVMDIMDQMLSLDRQNALRESYRQQQPDWQPATEVYADLVRSQLQPDSRVLDLGCGRGGLVEQLAFPLNQIVGIDPDFDSLREHRMAQPINGEQSLARVTGNSQSLPFRANSFDLIFSSWVLEHLAWPEVDWRQIGRVLRPSGSFVFITPNKRHPLAVINRSLGRFSQVQKKMVGRLYGRQASDTFATYYRANSPGDLTALAQLAGLTVIDLLAIPDPTYLAFNAAFFRINCWLEARLPADRQIHLVGHVQKSG